MRRYQYALLAVAIALTGCSGSSDNDNVAKDTNRAPVAGMLALTTQAEVTINDQLNATDPDGDSLTYQLVSNPMYGELSLSATGAFTYTPQAEYTGSDSFSYSVSDGTAFAVTGFVDITVEALEVSFNDSVRNIFSLNSTDKPVSVNGRAYVEDANNPGNFDDLIQD